MFFSLPTSCRAVAAGVLVAVLAGCSGGGIAPGNAGAGADTIAGSQAISPNQLRALANGQGPHSNVAPVKSGGWMSPQAKTDQNVFFWGDYNTNTITLYSNKGLNGKQIGQITTGLSSPERLFVDKAGSVYATNIGNSTVTGYKAGATTPFITLSTGIDNPTGLTVDAAGTIYVANVGGGTITEYPKGKTAPSVTINASAEYLATDSHDNLYASEYPSIVEYAKGTTTGKSLNLSIGSPGALEVDKKGTLIVLDANNTNLDYFPAGKTSPSKQIALGGFPFGLALNKANTQVYVSNDNGADFEIQSVAYPNGKKPMVKFNESSSEGWPLSVNPDNVLGK